MEKTYAKVLIVVQIYEIFIKNTPYIVVLRKYSGFTQANSQTRFLVDIYVLKTMIYCLKRVSLRKSCWYNMEIKAVMNFIAMSAHIFTYYYCL